VYALSSSGRIPVFKKSKRLYFSRDQLLDWVKTGRKKTIDEIEQEAQEYSLKNRYTKYKWNKKGENTAMFPPHIFTDGYLLLTT
jgi:hypothetical protein